MHCSDAFVVITSLVLLFIDQLLGCNYRTIIDLARLNQLSLDSSFRHLIFKFLYQ